MNLEFAVLLVHGDCGPRMHGAAGAYRPAMLPALAAATQQAQDLPRVVPLADGAPSVLLIPLRAHDVLVGHLCLGSKASGEPFRAEDRDLVATLSGHLAAV